jgi:hypothetical protein
MTAMGLSLAVGVWVLTTVFSLLLVVAVIVRLPATHFASTRRPPTPPSSLAGHLGRIARNVGGLVLIVIGLVLSVPGVPGQGLLTMLIGVMMVDFPGRRRVERWIVTRRGVLPAMNRLRRRFGAPPLVGPETGSRPRQ